MSGIALDTLLGSMTKGAADIAGDSWAKHSVAVTAHLKALAGDALKTQQMLATGKIDAQTAAEIIAMQLRAKEAIFTYIKLSGLQTAQKILDNAIGLLRAALTQATGLDLVAMATSIKQGSP